MKKRILSIALILCMLLTVLQITPLCVAATTTATEKDITLGTSAIQDPTEVTNNSGKYYTPNSYIYFGKNGTTPIKWRVLDADKANDGSTNGMFLLSEDVLASAVQFNADNGEQYQGSDAQTWCNSFAADSSNFSTAEQNTMLGVAKTDSVETLYEYSWAAASLTTADKLFFLSVRELADYVGNYNSAPGLTATNWWWLRSPYADSSLVVGVVYDTGLVTILQPLDNKMGGARPALNLNLSSVLFTSADVGGKTSGNDAENGTTGIFANKNYSDITGGDGYKLTLLDSTRNNFSASFKSLSGSTATISYSGAKMGTNEYISVIIKNGNDVKYYGRVAVAASSSGDVSITLPSDFSMANGDVLCVFNEQYNGDKNTDYASRLIEVTCYHKAHCICGDAHSSVGNHTDENILSDWKAISTGEALAQITESGNYYLSDNVTLSSMWKIANGTDITLCLNGKTLTADNANIGDTITIEGTLTITDCNGTGKITGTNPSNATDSKNHKILVVSTIYEGCTLNLYGGTITGIHAGNYPGGGVHNEGTFNMYGGSITGNSALNGGGVDNYYNHRSGHNDKGLAEFNFYGGTIRGNTATQSGSSGDDIYNRTNSKINANGGEVAGKVESHALITVAAGYTGTEFNGNVTNKGTIDGGIFYGTVSGNGTVTDNAKVTVTFISDDWTGTQKVLRGQKASAPTRAGYTYNECYNDGYKNEVIDLDGTAILEETILYAKFTPNTYTITYAPTLGGNSEEVTDTKTHGVALTLKSAIFTRDGYTQTGWKTYDGNSVYTLGGSYTADSAVTLYPVWTDTANPVISGITNGKTYCEAQVVTVSDNDGIASVTVNETPVTSGTDGKLTLSPAKGEQKLVVTDKTGNKTEMTVTVNDGHTGGTADCTHKAKCMVCGEEYGEIKLADTVIVKLPESDNKSPKTEDSNSRALLFAILFVSGGALAGTGLCGKRKKRFVE